MTDTNQPAGDKPTILVIDDDAVASRPLIISLNVEGYKVIQGFKGQEGIDLALKEHPDLIVLDYRMPDMDGVKVLERLRQDEWGKTVPVIFATNAYEVDVINAVMALGVRDYILKTDITLEDTVKLVGTYVPVPSLPVQ